MNAKRFYRIMLGLFGLLIVGSVALTVYANSWLKSRSQTLVDTKLEIDLLEKRQQYTQKEAVELTKYKDIVNVLDEIIPKDKDQARAIAELQKIADDIGVGIGSITFPASDLGTKAAKVVVTPAPAAGSSAAAQATPTAAPAAPSVTQAKPVEGISNVLGIEVSLAQIDKLGGIAGSGMSYNQLISFLESLEKNRRTMQVKTLQIQPVVDTNQNITGYAASVTLNIFVKP